MSTDWQCMFELQTVSVPLESTHTHVQLIEETREMTMRLTDEMKIFHASNSGPVDEFGVQDFAHRQASLTGTDRRGKILSKNSPKTGQIVPVVELDEHDVKEARNVDGHSTLKDLQLSRHHGRFDLFKVLLIRGKQEEIYQ